MNQPTFGAVPVSQIAHHSGKPINVVTKAIADLRKVQQLNSIGRVNGEEVFDWNTTNQILSWLGYYDRDGNVIYQS